ncbi:hypothetical protein SDC9_97386 [bioreactor metagenome]|uniref:Uncharacterized protein n=1 Tax=bioreactor metagenome TaxID=1076179 RepID=A0A645ALY4_9ZZZZ
MKTVCHAVEIDKSAGNSRDLSAPLRQLPDEVIRLRHDLFHRNQRALHLAHGDFVDAFFRGVERFFKILLVVHTVAHDLAARANQRALCAFCFDDGGIMLHVCRRGHKRDKVGQICHPARDVELAVPL